MTHHSRPAPLVCEYCLTIIDASDPCTFRELPRRDDGGGIQLSSGYIGAHDDCPTRAYERWRKKRAPHLPSNLHERADRGDTLPGHVTDLDVSMARRADSERKSRSSGGLPE